MIVAQAGLQRFTGIDWIVVISYLLIVVTVGVVVGRRKAGADEFFLAGRRMPVWAVALSVLATSLSAATFIGGPQQAYMTNLTYLSANIGGLIAIVIVAAFFLPAFYSLGVTSVYELLGDRFGATSKSAASAMFMIGRTFASGARLFMVAIPFSLIAFNSIETRPLLVSILIVALAASIYTMFGGIRAVIWTDVLQAIILIATIVIAFSFLITKIPLDLSGIFRALGETTIDDAGEVSKLTVIDPSLDPSRWYTIWTAMVGWTLFFLAAFGTDQDLVQRMLTCRSSREAGWSAILSQVLTWPVVALFLGMGLLLFIFYDRPDLMGSAAPTYAVDDSRTVFLEFIFREIGPGMRGMMMAGLFAAAMSSLDSALNAMASTTIADFYRPWRRRRQAADSTDQQREWWWSRIAIAVWALVLAGFASLCVVLYDPNDPDETLINFALGVMTFAYSGLLAVFLAALFTRRGNSVTAIAALVTGPVVVLLLRDLWWIDLIAHAAGSASLPEANHHSESGATFPVIAMPWQMVIATAVAFAVCCLGRRK